MLNLTCKFIILYNIFEGSGITNMQIMSLLDRHAVNQFNWEQTFLNKNVNEKVDIFHKTILNILNNLYHTKQ